MRPPQRGNSRKMADAVRIRLVLLPAAYALATWVFAASASAAASDGAQVTNRHGCEEIPNAGTLCTDDHVVSKFTSTPSGNTVIVGSTHFDVSFTSTSGACNFQQSGRANFQSVSRPQGSESYSLSTQEFRFPTMCISGDILVCESALQFHQVNGVPQFSRTSSECHLEPAP
jgi:hypothetical protein